MPLREPLPLYKNSPRWIYESFRRLELAMNKNALALAAVDRGEAPFQGGNPLVNSHHLLLDLTNYDDHPQYLYLRGRSPGQVAFGNNATAAVSGTGKGLYFQAFNNFTSSPINLRSSRIELESGTGVSNGNIFVRAQNIHFVERNSTYTLGDGLTIALGDGFANAYIYGGDLRLLANSQGGSPQLEINNTFSGSSNAAVLLQIIRKSTQNATGYLTGWYDSNGTSILSYIRGTDGAFVGPVVAGAGSSIEHSDTTDRESLNIVCTTNGTTTITSTGLFGSVQVGHMVYGVGILAGTTVTDVSGAPNSIIINVAATDSTTTNRRFASYDHDQYISKHGPNAQNIGTPPSGATPAGSLNISNSLGIGTTAVGVFEWVHMQKSAWTQALSNIFVINFSHTGTGSVVSSHKCLVITHNGAELRTSGAPLSTGIEVIMRPSCPAGLTEGEVLGMNMSVLVRAGGAGASYDEITGTNSEVGSASANAGITTMRAAKYTMRPGASAVGTMKGIDLLTSSITQQTGAVTNAIGIDMNIFVNSATQGVGGTITNWYGIRRENAIPSGVTNKWMFYIIADIPSIHAGPFRFGDTANPVHLVDIAAGTATRAALSLTSATPITTPLAGCIEFQTDDFFATITTGPARKAFVLDDGTRLTSGKIPIATTNGRLIDLVASSAYTPTNVTTDRSYDADATSIDELADTLGTLIADLQTKGILG